MPNPEERAKELHQFIDDPVAQDKVTIAVLTTDKETIIGTNERRLREKQRKALKKDEIEAPHIEANHAEEKAIKEAKKRNLKGKEIGTSRKICKDCQDLIESENITALSEFSNKPSKKRK